MMKKALVNVKRINFLEIICKNKKRVSEKAVFGKEILEINSRK